MMLSLATEQSELDTYLDHVFGQSEGIAYSPIKIGEEFVQNYFDWPTQRKELIEHITGNSQEGDVYIAPALFKSRVAASKGSVGRTNVLWAEFDGEVPSLEQYPDIPEPTLRVRSSDENHEHWYWRLDTELSDIGTIEELNRALTYQLGADASGWDANQILRPPLSFNHKRQAPVGLLSATHVQYEVDVFQRFPKPPASPQIELGQIPDVNDVLFKYAWTRASATLFRSTPDLGARSTALMQLGYLCAELGMADAEIYAVLRNADDRWKKFRNREDREKRLLELISRVRVKLPVAKSDEIKVYGLKSLLESEVKIDWFIEGLLQRQGYMLLTGPPGAGKTQVSLRFCLSLALGREFLGYPISERSKIIFFSLEMGHADLKFFLEQMVENDELTVEQLEELETTFLLVPLGESLSLDNPRGQAIAEKILDEFQPDGMFFDSLSATTGSSLSDESTVKAIMDWDSRMRQRHNLFSWYIHHHRKENADNKTPNKLSDVFGSYAITARATSVYCLWPDQDNLIMINLKRRLASIEAPYRVYRTMNGLNFTKGIDVHVKTPSSRKTFVENPIDDDAGSSAFLDSI